MIAFEINVFDYTWLRSRYLGLSLLTRVTVNTGFHIIKEGQKLQVTYLNPLLHLPTASALDVWLHLNHSHNLSSMQMRCWIYWKTSHHQLLCLPKCWRQWRVAVNLVSAQVLTSACLLEMAEQIQMKCRRYKIQPVEVFNILKQDETENKSV
jgi:hypothetical protein